jgi:hypothetical protein
MTEGISTGGMRPRSRIARGNARAKPELGWRPRHPSWRDGFFARDPE